jgi:amino acid adenylation domain-containing protein
MRTPFTAQPSNGFSNEQKENAASGTVSSSFGGLLRDADHKRLVAGNATHQDYPLDVLVPQLVAAQAAATPNAVAVAANHEVLTYEELEVRSNQIAQYLRSLGVGPETLVGLCLDRSCMMVIAALSVLKSGGAYLPLDPDYPVERLTFMLKDAQALLLLTKQHFAKRLTASKWRVINLDVDAPQISCCPAHSPDSTFRGKDLAYVIYTSGSTGQPKGVEITHDSLLNLVLWHQRTFGVRPSDRATQLASPGFDAAVWELWPYLTAGASVHVLDDAIRSEPEALRNWLVRERINIAFVPTPLAERMIALEWPPETSLRVLLTGADTLRSYPPATLPFRLVNNYGPTECTVVATSGTVPSDAHPDALPTIGRPIANTQVYILDEQLRPAPVGESGEIYIGGAGLARGYLNSPELTAEKFIPNPFCSKPNARLYRTGDLGRYLPEGQIAFLGRIDDQIKINGYRIEPNEIVAALNEHQAVQASAVLARERIGGDKYMIAYLALTRGSQITGAALRGFLRRRLPEYMVPWVFVRLESLPLTANGKVDRASLPAPSAENTIADGAYIAPRTLVGRRLVGILAKLLRIDQLGVNDNFFLLGGHSLLAAELIASIRDAFGVDLPLRTIFESPTAAGLSTEIAKSLLDKVNAMTPEEVSEALAQSPGQA